jgi:glycosyltransferase involved in cell wall biosynthesis
MPRASVILAFYNDVELLQLVLDALKHQYKGEFEVLIADDGSNPDAVVQAKKMLTDCPFPSQHFWHQDEGFRKTIVMNRAVMNAMGETLIFVDADCIPQKHFVRDHLRVAERGYCCVGRRVDCFREAIERLDLTRPDSVVSRSVFRLLFWSLTHKARNIEKGLRLPSMMAKKLSSHRWGIVGCNFSIQKSDLLSVNGFDERHSVQWGAEDSDIERRLVKAGIKFKDLRCQSTMIHFDVSYFKRHLVAASSEKKLPSFYDLAAAEDRAWTPFGILKEDRPDPADPVGMA